MHDHDGKYIKDKLRETAKFANMICQLVDDHDDLPEWVVGKAVVSANDLNDVYQYLESEYTRPRRMFERNLREVIRKEIGNILD